MNDTRLYYSVVLGTAGLVRRRIRRLSTVEVRSHSHLTPVDSWTFGDIGDSTAKFYPTTGAGAATPVEFAIFTTLLHLDNHLHQSSER